MTRQKLLVIGLDGFEQRVADRLIAGGELENVRKLMADSACLALDHDRHRRTGLAWEHVSTGSAPERSGRYAAVTFDPASYEASQRACTAPPFLANASGRVVAIDVPYFDLRQACNVDGLVNWGAHDPGVEEFSRPAGLTEEVLARIGAYPATDEIYAFAWPSAARAREVGERLTAALHKRTALTQWLLQERLPDWDLAISVVSELHSAIEPLWHGFDETHPLHTATSARAAREGLFNVYRALDEMIGSMRAAFPDAALLAFSMHGMGANDADVASMVLLPELLYRRTYGTSRLSVPAHWRAATGGIPMLGEDEHWDAAVLACIRDDGLIGRALRKARRVATRQPATGGTGSGGDADRADFPIAWMPSARYAPYWREMEAFAIPSFYDGRIRLNVSGREAHGFIEAADYDDVCAAVRADLMACRCGRTGRPVVREILRPHGADPFAVPDTDGDLEIIWDGLPLSFVHPRYGEIGPVPFRRTGGHTGGDGVFWLAGTGVKAGNHGRASAFDVAATIHDWLRDGSAPPASGESVLARLMTGETSPVPAACL